MDYYEELTAAAQAGAKLAFEIDDTVKLIAEASWDAGATFVLGLAAPTPTPEQVAAVLAQNPQRRKK